MAEKCAFWIPRYQQSLWRPALDIYRTPRGWLVKCDVAGIRPEDVRVSLAGRWLTIAGTRRDWLIEEGLRAYSLEIAYTCFERRVELPCDLQGADVRLEYRDGMLLIALTRIEERHDYHEP
jgi:HSP20 family protein